MASKSIKGVSIPIGADTSSFIKSLKKLSKEINYSEKQAKELQKQLELRFDEKTFSKAQAKVRSDLEATEQKARAIREQMQHLEKTSGVDTKSYKDLQVELEKATTQSMQLEEKLKALDKLKFENATKGITKLSSGLENAAKKTAVFSAAAVGAIAGVTKLAKSAVEVGDEIQTTADKFSLSAEAIQRWNYIALQSDVASEQLYKAMTKSRDAIGTAIAGGTSTAKNALESLVGDLKQLPTDTESAFMTVITALASVEDSTLQVYYANEIFGERIATDLIPLLKQGANGIAQLSREFEAVGYLTNEQVRSLADYDNALNIVNTRLENAKTELGLALIPVYEKFVNLLENNIIPAIKDVANWFENLSPGMQSTITNGLLLVAALSPVLLILSKITGAIPSLIKMLDLLKGKITNLHLGIGAVVASLGLVIGLFQNWGNMGTIAKIIGVIGTLTAALFGAALAFGVFHSSWSLGIAIGAIVAGITAATLAINSAKDEISTNIPDFKASDYNVTSGNYELPTTSSTANNYNDNTSNNYIDNSNITIYIEKNEYMSEQDIIDAVNKGLRQAKQSRT